jgi:hypothetical protein
MGRKGGIFPPMPNRPKALKTKLKARDRDKEIIRQKSKKAKNQGKP